MSEASNEYSVRTDCRVCGSEDLDVLFDFGDQYVSNFLPPGQERSGPRCPITIDHCHRCTLVQARYTPPPKELYRTHYWYKSGTTDTMRAALYDVSLAASKAAGGLRPGDVVVDIGSNDGTLLRAYAAHAAGVVTVGVEPAANLADEGRVGVTHFINDFWSAGALAGVGKKAKVITACGMFYDLDDPNDFVHAVCRSLAPGGVFVAQLMCLRQTIDRMDVGNFAHEHLEFYSLRSLMWLMAANGLTIFDIEQNDVNGGSYRVFARRAGDRVGTNAGADRVERALREEDSVLHRSALAAAYKVMNENKDRCVAAVGRALADGPVYGYGASTKGNVILQWYGLGKGQITALADRSPFKVGLCAAGTGIPIVSEDEFRQADPPHALVLPYAFLQEFVAREDEWRRRGGRFIVPLPRLRII